MSAHVSNITTPRGEYMLSREGCSKVVISHDYNYTFDGDTGMFHRWGATIDDDPSISPFGPEILDIEISVGGCNGGCSYCYKKNSTRKEKHMNLVTFTSILEKMPQLLTQIAIGITNLESNPDLPSMLRATRDMGIVPNLTTANADPKTVALIAPLLGAVAVSRNHNNKKMWADAIVQFYVCGTKQVNTHVVVSDETYDLVHVTIDNIVSNLSVKHCLNAIVFLSLKPKGSAADMDMPERWMFEEFIKRCEEHNIGFGFDSCSAPTVERINEKWLPYMERCESTLFSAYINVDGMFFPCSFTEGEYGWKEGLSVLDEEDFLRDVWYNEKTDLWRGYLLSNKRNCPSFDLDD